MPTLHQRASGILLHITSLPTPGPVGRLGSSAVAFLDFLQAAGQSWWQTLPVNPIGKGNSPYSTISSFAGEAIFCDLDLWRNAGLIDDNYGVATSTAHTDFEAARTIFADVSRRAFGNFCSQPKSKFAKGMASFCQAQAYWLDDYTLFAAIASELGTDWSTWPQALRDREKAALKEERVRRSNEILYHQFLQYSFDLSWKTLRAEAKKRGIGLIGDIPIFVAHDSADVWANQSYFWLKPDGSPKFVAGVPPDYFNKDGQLWGNALYNWPKLKQDGFAFWTKRMRRMLDLFDLIRIDHFIGFYRYWEIPAGAPNAKQGRWVLVPGAELLRKIIRTVGKDRVIAEDLGLVVPGVLKLRDQFDIPGMRVFQFGFGNDGDSGYHMPYQCPSHSVAYTGTHDNDTLVGWFSMARDQSSSPKPSFDFAKMQVVVGNDSMNVHWHGIKAVAMSPAKLAIFQMQDALGLGTDARMNVPGVANGNWGWRLKSVPGGDLAQQLHGIARATDRIPQRPKSSHRKG